MKTSNIKSRKINQAELSKTLRKIEQKIESTLKYYIPDTDDKEVKTVTKYMMKDIKEIVAENMANSKRIIRRKYTAKTLDKIIKAFENVKIVKRVCYKSDSKPDHMKMIVIFDSKNYSYAEKKIFDISEKIDAGSLFIETEVSDIGYTKEYPRYFKNTTTIFER